MAQSNDWFSQAFNQVMSRDMYDERLALMQRLAAGEKSVARPPQQYAEQKPIPAPAPAPHMNTKLLLLKGR